MEARKDGGLVAGGDEGAAQDHIVLAVVAGRGKVVCRHQGRQRGWWRQMTAAIDLQDRRGSRNLEPCICKGSSAQLLRALLPSLPNRKMAHRRRCARRGCPAAPQRSPRATAASRKAIELNHCSDQPGAAVLAGAWLLTQLPPPGPCHFKSLQPPHLPHVAKDVMEAGGGGLHGVHSALSAVRQVQVGLAPEAKRQMAGSGGRQVGPSSNSNCPPPPCPCTERPPTRGHRPPPPIAERAN